MKKKVNWSVLEKLIDQYRSDAKKCLDIGTYYAGLVSVRAALETTLLARFLLEIFDWSEDELKKYNIRMNGWSLDLPNIPTLYEMIEGAYRQGLIRKTGYQAAHRIRKWGNKIHGTEVANQRSLPKIGKRNLSARLRDLDLVFQQLVRTL